MRPIYCYFFILSLTAASCVSSSSYKALLLEKQKSDSLYGYSMQTLKSCQGDNDRLNRQKSALRDSMNDAGLQLSVVQDVAAIDREGVDLLAGDNTGDADLFRVDLEFASVDFNRFCRGAKGQLEISGSSGTDTDYRRHGELLKAGS